MTANKAIAWAAILAAAISGGASAQSPPPPYGAPVTLVQARRVILAAEAEAQRQGLAMAFAVVEPSGELAAFERMDGVQYGSIAVSQEKARTSARFRRSSKAFSDAVAGGRTAVVGIREVIPVEGGVPLVAGGKMIGAIGVSGGSPAQDTVVAQAAAAALK